MEETQASGKRFDTCLLLVMLAVGCAILLVVLVLLLQSIDGIGGREAARRANCVSNMKLIGIALQGYHDEYKCLPPAFVADASGKPMHSWRVLLLPFMEDQELQDLHKQYRSDEPWNGPNNSKLAAKCPAAFRCPSDESDPGHTSYVAVVGDETAWPTDKRVTLRDIHDGTAKTISIVESAGSGINWLEPRDLAFEQAARGINTQDKPGVASPHPDGSNVLICDGSVHFLNEELPLDILRGLLTRSGGEMTELPEN